VARVPVPGGAVELLPAEGVDAGEAERRRDAHRERLRAEIARAEGKLANQGFVAKAPEHLVEAEREKLERLRRELEAV
jgi:valyl-tRNA synthetase